MSGPEKPPIMMTMPGELTFRADGTWVHDGVVVTNPQIALYFSRRLRYSSDHGRYVVEVDGKCVAVRVEDTPVVVRSIYPAAGVPQTLLLNDASEVPLSSAELLVGSDNILYCSLPDGREARLLRPAMQALTAFIESTQGEFQLVLGDSRRPIKRRRGNV